MAKYTSKSDKSSKVKPALLFFGVVIIGGLLYLKFKPSNDKNTNENSVETTETLPMPQLTDENETTPENIGEVIGEKVNSPVLEPVKSEENATSTEMSESALLKQAREIMAQGEFVKARDLVEQELAKHQKYSTGWFNAANLISEINTLFINKDLRCPEKTFYVVKSGDVLIRIAYKNNTTVNQIFKNNPRLNPGRPIIQPQQTLSVLSGEWHLEASKKHFTLALYNGKKLFKIYKISIGREGRTPIGEFIITDKVEKPNYRGIPYSGDGATGNELGTRWMRVEPIGETPQDLQGYGIHGTWEPESIGRAASNGCLRLLNEQVEELFDLLPSKLKTVKLVIEE